jgi:hypothetical protein
VGNLIDSTFDFIQIADNEKVVSCVLTKREKAYIATEKQIILISKLSNNFTVNSWITFDSLYQKFPNENFGDFVKLIAFPNPFFLVIIIF